ncbi:hypothetical protein PSSM2_149 [Prochlorococcus phage P-SSM2]|uniref:HNH endonuclease n=1 Tax=Prochlorococcus phage P-SSM2 TaxID=268746 RepID=Q58MK5_BPPRM|nr:HNH endonuclease [Prochlorococcus phage P-SSM2]AAX44527.1 hypothetical protein PSSM2_149 [Prochlorococcus phage P-SSM2]ACY76028.1 conserved hypothetical protein [Prochlorococcus phage P-SSM2]
MPNTPARKELREERFEWLRESKRNKPCADCGGIFDPVCMDYHHIDPSTKYHPGGVGGVIKSGYSMKRIQEEIDKCVCLCANCHRIRHKDDP